MLINYLRIALRNLTKNKVFSFINIFGLAIGITCCILIMLWVHDELTFNKWMPKYDRLYTVMVRAEYDGRVNVWNANPPISADVMKDENADIANVVKTDWGGSHLLAPGDKTDRTGVRKKGYYVSDAYLQMFEHPMIKGDRSTALKEINSIVLTESTARALFGDKDPIDQTVRMNDEDELKVTGVIRDIPSNTTDQFDFLTTWDLYLKQPWVKDMSTKWDAFSFNVAVELTENADKTAVDEKLRTLLTRNGQTDFKKEQFLHPMSKWRLYSQFENGVAVGGLITYVQMFSIIAGVILLIACVNFMNLATARSEKRAVEVGVRKSVGSGRFQLVYQFIGESIVITAISFATGLLLAQLLLPSYNQLVSKHLTMPYTSPVFWIGSVVAVLVVGTVAGSYPAFYLSAFKPALVLKGARSTSGGALPRKVLVTLQFAFSMVLMAATIVVYQQIQHVRQRDIGYSQDNMLIVDYNLDVRRNFKAIKNELLQTGVVAGVTKSNAAITDQTSWSPVDWAGKPEEQKVFFVTTATEYDYVSTMGIKILEGRDFSEEYRSDSASVVINAEAKKLMGLDEETVGSTIYFHGAPHKIIGVIGNAVSGSPYEPVQPQIVIFRPEWIGKLTIRLSPTDNLPASLESVSQVFKKYCPAYPFEFKFADQAFQAKFATINLTSRLASIFAVLTFIITGLGLFGLAAFTASQRTKEMGIRKVMGASVTQLVQLVTKDFSVLVVIAFIASSPLAWWLLNQHLQQYNYRIDVQWWIFAVVGLGALIFAIVIVSTQALRAARTNPANSLRSE